MFSWLTITLHLHLLKLIIYGYYKANQNKTGNRKIIVLILNSDVSHLFETYPATAFAKFKNTIGAHL